MAAAAKPEVIWFTESAEANRLLADDPMALLVGFALDQQVTVQKAFSGPLVISERVGSLSASALASADLEPLFREKPAVHRYPGVMAKRVHDLAVWVRDEYGGDAAAVWTDADSTDALRSRLMALPGFGEMKVVSLASVLSRRFGVSAADALVPDHMTLGDVVSAETLAESRPRSERRRRRRGPGNRGRAKSSGSFHGDRFRPTRPRTCVRRYSRAIEKRATGLEPAP